ncbi:MAG: hypothetical protein ACR2IS_19175 [Nitrososphaeraceae archaeon]
MGFNSIPANGLLSFRKNNPPEETEALLLCAHWPVICILSLPSQKTGIDELFSAYLVIELCVTMN